MTVENEKSWFANLLESNPRLAGFWHTYVVPYILLWLLAIFVAIFAILALFVSLPVAILSTALLWQSYMVYNWLIINKTITEMFDPEGEIRKDLGLYDESTGVDLQKMMAAQLPETNQQRVKEFLEAKYRKRFTDEKLQEENERLTRELKTEKEERLRTRVEAGRYKKCKEWQKRWHKDGIKEDEKKAIQREVRIFIINEVLARTEGYFIQIVANYNKRDDLYNKTEEVWQKIDSGEFQIPAEVFLTNTEFANYHQEYKKLMAEVKKKPAVSVGAAAKQSSAASSEEVEQLRQEMQAKIEGLKREVEEKNVQINALEREKIERNQQGKGNANPNEWKEELKEVIKSKKKIYETQQTSDSSSADRSKVELATALESLTGFKSYLPHAEELEKETPDEKKVKEKIIGQAANLQTIAKNGGSEQPGRFVTVDELQAAFSVVLGSII